MFVTALYFFVYLWRWEWNRALIAGVLFVAAEVAMATATILRPAAPPRRAPPGPPTPPCWPASGRRPRRPVTTSSGWRPSPSQLSVFVPVLIGMGVVASGLAWLVERLARATAGPVAGAGARRPPRRRWRGRPAASCPMTADDPLAVLRGAGPPAP